MEVGYLNVASPRKQMGFYVYVFEKYLTQGFETKTQEIMDES